MLGRSSKLFWARRQPPREAPSYAEETLSGRQDTAAVLMAFIARSASLSSFAKWIRRSLSR